MCWAPLPLAMFHVFGNYLSVERYVLPQLGCVRMIDLAKAIEEIDHCVSECLGATPKPIPDVKFSYYDDAVGQASYFQGFERPRICVWIGPKNYEVWQCIAHELAHHYLSDGPQLSGDEEERQADAIERSAWQLHQKERHSGMPALQQRSPE